MPALSGAYLKQKMLCKQCDCDQMRHTQDQIQFQCNEHR